MVRKIIVIDEDKCTGCGVCADACHEGAIDIVNGIARLVREHFCDGLGDCLPACPEDAITFEEREAPAYDEAAVLAAKSGTGSGDGVLAAKSGSGMKQETPACEEPIVIDGRSQLRNWPPQIKLCPTQAPYFDGADVLIATDCTAFSYGSFHQDFMKDRITLIGCPKLDAYDYSEKLAVIFGSNDIRSVTLLRMEVPCCGGMEFAVKTAISASGRDIPLDVVTVGINGSLL